MDRSWSVFKTLCLLYKFVLDISQHLFFPLLVRSVEGKPGQMEKLPVMNPQHQLPITSQRPKTQHRQTGCTANKGTLRRRREKGFHLRQKGTFHCGTATRPHCLPSPWTRPLCPENSTLRKTLTRWSPQELWCLKPSTCRRLDTGWLRTVTGMRSMLRYRFTSMISVSKVRISVTFIHKMCI